MKKNYNNVSLLYSLLIDYLLLNSDIDNNIDDFKTIVLSETFVDHLEEFLRYINEDYKYPSIALENSKKLVKYIEKNSDLSNILGGCYDEISNMNEFSYEKYKKEYDVRQVALSIEQQEAYTMCTMNDFEEFLLNDFIITMALNTPKDRYFEEYYFSFVLNKNFLFSINKLMNISPEMFKDKEIKERVKMVLSINQKLISELYDDVIIEYVKRNYNKTDEVINFNEEQVIKTFTELNENTLINLNNLGYMPFTFDEYQKYYDYITLNSYVYSNYKIDVSTVNLENIYKFIDDNNVNRKVEKDKLLSALYMKRASLTKQELETYNNYVAKINTMEESEISLDLINFMLKADNKEYVEVIKDAMNEDYSKFKNISSPKYDLYNFEQLLNIENKRCEEINGDTMFLNSMKRFITEAPSMFMNSNINEKAHDILSNYDNSFSKKLLKKINKIKK